MREAQAMDPRDPAQAAHARLEVCLGLPPAMVAAPQLLRLHGPRGDWLLRVGGPLELITLPTRCIHPLPPLLAAREPLPGLRALALWPAKPSSGRRGGARHPDLDQVATTTSDTLVFLLDALALASHLIRHGQMHGHN